MRLSATSYTHTRARRTHTHPSLSQQRSHQSSLLACIVDLSACLFTLPTARILSRLHATNTACRCSDAPGSLNKDQGCILPTSRHWLPCSAAPLGSQECKACPRLGQHRRPHAWQRNVYQRMCRPSNLASKRAFHSREMRSCSKPRCSCCAPTCDICSSSNSLPGLLRFHPPAPSSLYLPSLSQSA